MRIALLLFTVFVCWQMIAAGVIKEPPSPAKCDKDHDDNKKDHHSGGSGEDKEPEKDKGEWKKKDSHSSHDHHKGKLPLHAGEDVSGLEHLAEKIPLVDKLSGSKGLGGILDLNNGKNDLINLNGLKKSLPLIGYLPGKVIGGAIGSAGGKGLLGLKGITGKLPLKGILGDSDCDDDENKKSHGIKRRGLIDDWNSSDDDSHEKNEKGDGDWKKGGSKSKDVRREKNKGKSDAWKANNDKEGKRKGSKSEEHKSKDVQISVNLKDKKDSASWSNAWKSKNGKNGKSSSDSWDHEQVWKEIPWHLLD